MRSVVVFSVLRVLAFAVPFGILLLFPAFQELPWLAAVFAAVIGLALSMLFLRRPLDAVSAGLSERRSTRRDERADAAVEDEANDAARADGLSAPAGAGRVAGEPAGADRSTETDVTPDAEGAAGAPRVGAEGSPEVDDTADAAPGADADQVADAGPVTHPAISPRRDQPTNAQESSPA